MRQELVLGFLVSTGLHLAAFLSPWTIMCKKEMPWIPRPSLEISLHTPFPAKELPKTDSTGSEPPWPKEQHEYSTPSHQSSEPSMIAQQDPLPAVQPSRPKVKPRPELKKQQTKPKTTSSTKMEDMTDPLEQNDGASVTGASQSRGQESLSTAGKQEISSALPQLEPTGEGGPPKAQLQKAFPRYGRNPKPLYPEIARKRGYEGTVVLSVVVLKDGSPGLVRVTKPSGYKILDDAAKEAVAHWEFVPGFLGQDPVEMEVEVPILFRLER